MARGLVVGIFPGADPAAISSALSAAQIDGSKVKVLLKSSATGVEIPTDSELTFEDVFEDMEGNSLADDMTKGLGIMGDGGGTGVPGISGGRQASLGSFSSASEPAKNYVGSLAIPDDEADNFNEAIEDGRAVVIYADAGDDAGKISAAFKSAGLRNVRSY